LTGPPFDIAKLRPRPRDGLAFVLLDDEIVVHDADARSLHHLSPAATLVWLRCDGDHTVEDIARRIADGSVTPFAEIRRDVIMLIQQLRAVSLLVSEPTR
jgi:hypothetical protein